MEEIKKENPLQYDKLTKILFDAPKERDVSAVKFLSPYSKFSMIINLMMSLCVKNALEKDGIFFVHGRGGQCRRHASVKKTRHACSTCP